MPASGKRWTMTAKEIAQRQKSNRKDGIYAFRDRGELSLDDPKRNYYKELRERFKTEPGRREYREELAAALAMICDLGFASLRETAEQGGDIWTSGPIKTIGTFVNSLARLLDSWPEEKEYLDVTEALTGESESGEPGQGEEEDSNGEELHE